MPFTAQIDYRVPYADSDQMGVVYYANFLVYFERVRNEILRGAGYTYREMEADGLQLPVLEAHCEYKSPARYDDLLSIRGSASALGRTRIKVNCEVWREGTLLATGHTIHACISVDKKRPVRLPKPLQEQP